MPAYPHITIVCFAALTLATGCNTTPVATPVGLAQWYPQGTAGQQQQQNLPKPSARKPSAQQPVAKKLDAPPRATGSGGGMDQLALLTLQNRLKDLEEKYQHLWLKYQALEKGLALGLMPPEVAASLNKSLDKSPKAPSASAGDRSRYDGAQPAGYDAAPAPTAKHHVVDPPAPAAQPAPKAASLSRGIKGAIALYQKAKYGRALIAFQQLQKQYSAAELGGNDHYWIGLCWYHLKDFSKARESLDVFQTRYPRHNLARKASFYQAKIDLDIGLTKKGVAALEELIQLRSSDEVGKLARSEIESLNDELR